MTFVGTSTIAILLAIMAICLFSTGSIISGLVIAILSGAGVVRCLWMLKNIDN